MNNEDAESISSNDMSNVYQQQLDEHYQNDCEFCDNVPDIISKKYIYPGLSLLNKTNIDECADEFDDVVVNCCTYQVNDSGEKPFLQFILRKNEMNHATTPDLLTFPSFKRRFGESLVDMCAVLQKVLCISYSINSNNCEYKGFLNDRNIFYVFYELKEDSIKVHDLYRRNDLWLVLIDEIVNHNSCCNFIIDENVSRFFSNYINFACLKDENDNYIEIPIVGYTGVKRKEINLLSCFGIPKTFEPCLNENFFYFTDYQNAIKMGLCYEETNNRAGIIRFALFLGNVSVKITESDVDKDDCDSIYVGSGEKTPLWALKRYEQQLPLTSHFIDKLNPNETWEIDGIYYIC